MEGCQSRNSEKENLMKKSGSIPQEFGKPATVPAERNDRNWCGNNRDGTFIRQFVYICAGR
jgi:hypothetical protein